MPAHGSPCMLFAVEFRCSLNHRTFSARLDCMQLIPRWLIQRIIDNSLLCMQRPRRVVVMGACEPQTSPSVSRLIVLPDMNEVTSANWWRIKCV